MQKGENLTLTYRDGHTTHASSLATGLLDWCEVMP
jgi:hypothetical protein